MIDISEKKDCVGCRACGDICPKGAISFVIDEEGFAYPKVDEAKCIKCGLCLKTCPIVQAKAGAYKKGDASKVKSYAAIHNDISEVFASSSGGMFGALATKTLESGGFVGGAVWNEDFSISQIVTDAEKDLSRLRCSKYAQADATGYFNAIKQAVGTGKRVLICATPCQVAAIRFFLDRDYDNLCLVDFVCHGVSSPLVMKKYIEYIAKKYGSEVVEIRQRSNELGWRQCTDKFTLANNRVVYERGDKSLFMRGYLDSNLFCRPSCYDCKFKGVPFHSDITIADAWGVVDKLDKSWDNNLGTSFVICNNAKGSAFFDEVADRVRRIEIDYKDAYRANPMINVSIADRGFDRKRFYEELKSEGLESALTGKTLIRGPKKVKRFKRLRKIIKKHWRNLFTLIKINGLKNLLEGRPLLIPCGRVLVSKAKSAKVIVTADTLFGRPKVKGSKEESYLIMGENAELVVNSGSWIMSGANVKIFDNARVELGRLFTANYGLTIVCGKSITIGDYSGAGPRATIRDFNGEHYVNTPNYTTSAPIFIDQNVWLGSESMIMPGVTIGSGSVIAARALVNKSFAPHSLIAGIPAKLIRSGVKLKLL